MTRKEKAKMMIDSMSEKESIDTIDILLCERGYGDEGVGISDANEIKNLRIVQELLEIKKIIVNYYL
tara:strand:+ start:338 stop:538 length:201 start_codon:yes stop_codon:yes gene_type:complete